MLALLLVVSFLGLVDAQRFHKGHVLIRDGQSGQGILWWLWNPYNPPRSQLQGTPVIAVPLSGDRSKDKWTVMLGEPDQFARAFIFSPSLQRSGGFYEFSHVTGQLTFISTPFSFVQPLCGCRNLFNLDYYILGWDSSNSLALWKFQPPTLPNQGYTFSKQSVNLRRDFNPQTITSDKCAFVSGNLTFGATRDGYFAGMINLNPSGGASTFTDTKFATVTAIGNSPLAAWPWGILTDQNGPSTFADLNGVATFSYDQAVPTVMDKRVPSFVDPSGGDILYPMTPQGPLVGVKRASINGNRYLDISPYWIVGGWTNGTILGLSN